MSAICGFLSLGQAHGADADLGATVARHTVSGCAITADASLYYRDELLVALGLEADHRSDAELILIAYLRWGENCVDHLDGDFAFAIWDPRDRKLFCARDAYGMRPFYYHHLPGECLVFASDAREVLSHPQVPFAINEGRIADFIVERLEWIDYTSTFFEGVYRLPPAHKLIATSVGIQVTEYYAPKPGAELKLSSDEEYREGFLDVFSRAVAERLRVPGGIAGSMLSGGMDSGSIVAVAQGLIADRGGGPLPTYSLARRRGTDCLESQRIYATLDHLGLSGTQIFVDEEDSLLDHLGTDMAEPFDGQFLFLSAVYEAANRDGIHVVLDGAAGDIVFNAGPYIWRLLRSGRFRKAWCEILGERAFWGGPSLASALVRYLGGAYSPDFIKKPLRRPRQRMNERRYVDDSLISQEFARQVDIEARFDRMSETFSGPRSIDPSVGRISKIRPCLTAGKERYARIAATSGIEARDPFTDQRVVDFCSRLPDNQLARNGWPKFLLRNAMAGKLPDEVRWARGRPHIGYLYNENFVRREIKRRKLELDRLTASLGHYVDPSALRAAWSDFEAGGEAETVHSAYVLSLWLEQSVKRPVVCGRRIG